MPVEASNYYPPRARWYSVFFYFGNAVRRRLALDRLALPRGIKWSELCLGFLVPGLAVYLRGPKLWGRAALVGSVALLLIFIVWLGHPVANVAFGLLISLHATGFVYYCSPVMAKEPLRSRLGFTFLALLGIGLGVYLPMQHIIQNHWLMPLRSGNQIIIVSVQDKPGPLKQGDWAAFKTEKGILFGPIVGLGGERIDSISVPEKHWLMRAQFERRYYEDGGLFFAGSSYSGGTVSELTIVSQEEFVGQPLKHWFWRKQTLP